MNNARTASTVLYREPVHSLLFGTKRSAVHGGGGMQTTRVVGDRWVDLTDPDVYKGGVPHATFQRMRDTEPVAWGEEPDGSGFWSLTRYDDIVAASKDFTTFTSTQGVRL